MHSCISFGFRQANREIACRFSVSSLRKALRLPTLFPMNNPASNKEWKKWGEIDPLFGVASWHNKRIADSSAWTDEEFYALGQLDWEVFSKQWERYGVNRESCLEIGCGAGRITKALASYFKQVHAIDVSQNMIDYAQKNISAASVEFSLTNGTDIPLADSSLYSIFSTHVFQHFDSLSVAERYFAELSRVMRPGATLMIHMPVYIWPSKISIYRSIYAVQKRVGDIRAGFMRFLMQCGLAKPIMRGLRYPVDYLFDVLPTHGLEDIIISHIIAKTNKSRHSFVFAKKAHHR